MTIPFDVAPLGMGDPLNILIEVVEWVIKKVRGIYGKYKRYRSMPQ